MRGHALFRICNLQGFLLSQPYVYVNDASFPDNCKDKSLQSCHIGDYDVIVSSVLNSGFREDILYGGGGRNTFNNNDDGEIDQLFVLSDYHSRNY